jgi:three-Cys-motif partner protein
MQHQHFEELKEWSERKHELVIRYLKGFVKILGGSIKGVVYYVDGFAGPGIYDDGAKGSPIRAAEYAQTLDGKHYELQCINVEVDTECFENLKQSTLPYAARTTNHCGAFSDHVSEILVQIGDQPTVFFLDPFGLKGIEWSHIYPILTRPRTTEVLLRINPQDISRLAGFAGSDSPGAAKKRQVVTSLYGFADSEQWEKVWYTKGPDGLVELYKRGLLGAMVGARGRSYVCSYAIKSIEGTVKYYLIFTTRHPKGAVLMSDIIYGREKRYERDVKEYEKECLESQPVRQLTMFDALNPPPTDDDIFSAQVVRLKEDIGQEFEGKQASRLRIHEAMLNQWFGKVSGSHFTRAFRELEEDEGKIANRSGPRSADDTEFTFN